MQQSDLAAFCVSTMLLYFCTCLQADLFIVQPVHFLQLN